MLSVMETSHEIDVTNLDAEHRHALEDVIGRQLRLNQRLVISVTEKGAHKAARPSPQSLSDWAKVYEGLTDEQIAAIDRDARTRADVTRRLP